MQYVYRNGNMATQTPVCVTLTSKNATLIQQSKAKHSKAKKIILLKGSLCGKTGRDGPDARPD